MKRKILNTLVALVLLLGLSLVMAAPVAATVSQPTVTVTVPAIATVSDYTIVFTTTVAMTTADGDTITIEFPTGTTADTLIASVVAGDVTVNTVAVTSVAIVGTRLSITPSADVAAGEVTVAITNTHITNPNPEGIAYTLKVYTSQEPTAVTSAAYIIDSVISACTVANSPTYVDTVSAYTITPTLVTALTLAAVDTITITFPATTTVPASITLATYVTVGGTALASTSAYSASGQTVTLTVPADVDTGARAIVFLAGAGIKNPTTVGTSTWTVSIYTSQDRAVKTSSTYSTTVALEAKITQIAWKTVDAYIPLATASSAFVIETRDVNGVPAKVTAETSFLLGPGGGTFYSDAECTTSPIGTIVIAASASASADFYYKNATAGTKTLTASEVVTHSPVWTAASTTVIVNPALALWGGGELKASYATFALALAAALPYDTIKVAPSTYEEQIRIVKSNITIESTAGADTTILYYHGYFVIEILNPDVTISGFTITSPISAVTDQRGIFVRGVSGVTIQRNKFTNLSSDAICVYSENGVITSGLIDNNTVTGIGATARDCRGGIWVQTYSTNAISGVTISNNTISGYGAKTTAGTARPGIKIAEVSGDISDITITGNTISNCDVGIYLWGNMVGMTTTKAVASNSINNCYTGVAIMGGAAGGALTAVISLVKNTIASNTAYGILLTKVMPDYTGTMTLEGTIKIQYNDITGNGDNGILNAFTTVTNTPVATHNYWGSATGPLATANPSGAGDAVSVGVTYSPWLAASQATVIASGKSQYAISVLLSNAATLSGSTYSGGWNTFSTPISLDSSADTWSEIKTLASATANVASAYAWNGITWATPSDITPLNAIFVQLTPGSSISVPILYGTTLLPAATRSLHATAGSYTGWELISLAKLAAQHQDTTLASISSKYSQVIDPISGDVIAVGTDMAVGAGYWVFMTADGTLAGFSVTPVTFVPVP